MAEKYDKLVLRLSNQTVDALEDCITDMHRLMQVIQDRRDRPIGVPVFIERGSDPVREHIGSLNSITKFCLSVNI